MKNFLHKLSLYSIEPELVKAAAAKLESLGYRLAPGAETFENFTIRNSAVPCYVSTNGTHNRCDNGEYVFAITQGLPDKNVLVLEKEWTKAFEYASEYKIEFKKGAWYIVPANPETGEHEYMFKYKSHTEKDGKVTTIYNSHLIYRGNEWGTNGALINNDLIKRVRKAEPSEIQYRLTCVAKAKGFRKGVSFKPLDANVHPDNILIVTRDIEGSDYYPDIDCLECHFSVYWDGEWAEIVPVDEPYIEVAGNVGSFYSDFITVGPLTLSKESIYKLTEAIDCINVNDLVNNKNITSVKFGKHELTIEQIGAIASYFRKKEPVEEKAE